MRHLSPNFTQQCIACERELPAFSAVSADLRDEVDAEFEAMSVDWGRAQLSGEFLLLHFDEQHRLLDYAFSRWDESAGGGAALQPSFAGIDVVDVFHALHDASLVDVEARDDPLEQAHAASPFSSASTAASASSRSTAPV